MVISHRHRYLFVELPLTGSTAIRRELCAHYAGEPILRNHSTYYDFLKIASPEEQRYFVFSGIRNPLDHAVSLYFKYKTDHKQKFTNPKKIQRRKGIVGQLDVLKYRFVTRGEADFPTYFKRFYKIPYNTWSGMSHKRFDFIIRFENLQEDFATTLQRIGLEQVRPLPLVNKTTQKDRDFLTYYTPDTIARAKRVFGPYMRQWGYTFPPEWGVGEVSAWDQAGFAFFNMFRTVYWRYLRYRI
jgi:hypothetical protein